MTKVIYLFYLFFRNITSFELTSYWWQNNNGRVWWFRNFKQMTSYIYIILLFPYCFWYSLKDQAVNQLVLGRPPSPGWVVNSCLKDGQVNEYECGLTSSFRLQLGVLVKNSHQSKIHVCRNWLLNLGRKICSKPTDWQLDASRKRRGKNNRN